jgi:hypothetical protein
MSILGPLIAGAILLGSVLALLLTRRPGGGSALGCGSHCTCRDGGECRNAEADEEPR